MELANGVYILSQTVQHGSDEHTIHPAAVETTRGILLIDAGYPGELNQVAAELANNDQDLNDVWGVLITHQDGDHAGGLSELRDRVDPVVFAQTDCAPFVDGRLDPLKSEGDRYPAVTVDVEITGGTTFATVAGPLKVIHTPGHTPGHVSVYLPDEKVLIAADALTATEETLAGPNPDFTANIEDATESVGELSEYDIEQTLCYHGGFVDQGTGAIAQIWRDLAE